MAIKMMIATAMAMAIRTTPSQNLAQPAFVARSIDDLAMKPSPIEPSWILEGDPVARVAGHSRSADDAAETAVWDCTAGEFRWYFGWDETVVILEGSVEVTTEDGVIRVLRAGDIGYFVGGTWATWRVDEYVRKVAFLRKRFPAPVAMLYRMRNLLRDAVKGQLAA